MDTEYGDMPGGLAGNDDAGQMSAWYIFSSLGFYPVCPGSPYYIIGCPVFDEASLNLEDGKTFTIKAAGASKENCYIQSATLNGKPYTKNYISHQDITNGGVLEFVMGSTPNENWGNKPEDCPPHLLPEL
jgi:putative alpha-1,2-mannosidase